MIEANSKLYNAVLIAKIAYVHFFTRFSSTKYRQARFLKGKCFCAEIFFHDKYV